MPRKPNPELVDDEAPALDDEWFARARPAAEVLPEIFPPEVAAELLKKRGRPRKASPKLHLNLRLSRDVVEAFKSTGAGWQTRIDAALREWMKSHSP
jgi:uncharacterized protein (DUF4415 family)